MREQRCGFGLRNFATFATGGRLRDRPIAGPVAVCAIFAACASGIAAHAATANSVLHVSATVIATCNIQPLAQPRAAKIDVDCVDVGDTSLTSLKPVVTFTHDKTAGIMRELVEF